MSDSLPLPPLILLGEYADDWGRYLEAVYAAFREDFIQSRPQFLGAPVVVGKQLIDGKERTFWHLISEGGVEVDRVPDFRRCERIAWVRTIIDHAENPAVLSWPNTRSRKERHVLWAKQVDFLVVLEKRPGCWWLWTAYRTDRDSTRRKLDREYEEHLKSQRRP